MHKDIIYGSHLYNTGCRIFFASTIDAGYYGEKDSDSRIGAISVSVQLDSASFKTYMDYMVSFGFFLVTALEKELYTLVSSDDIRAFKKRNGAFNVIISDIPETGFSEKIAVIPFILIKGLTGEKRIFGETITASIYDGKVRNNGNIRWLGEKL